MKKHYLDGINGDHFLGKNQLKDAFYVVAFILRFCNFIAFIFDLGLTELFRPCEATKTCRKKASRLS